MAYRRFFIEHAPGDRLTIDGELFHHVRDVCRFDVGAKFEVLPGDGTARLVQITAIGKRDLTAEVLKRRDLPPPTGPAVVLCVSIPKLPKVDWIVEKCVELGVARIKPFTSDYSFLRKPGEVSENRVERWRKIVRAATQQTGRGDLMEVDAAVTLPQLLEDFAARPGLAGVFPYEGLATQTLSDTLARVRSAELKQVWAFVGSEGGFSAPEVELFAKYGLAPTSMGEQILRVETACLALISVLKYELGTLN